MSVNISGSRAAAILGLSQYRTPVDVWLEICESRSPGFMSRRGYVREPFAGNASTRFGLAFEDAVLELCESVTGEIIDRQRVFSPEEGITSCTVDGLTRDGVLIEAKTTTEFSHRLEWGEPGTDRIPTGYQIQVQHNMLLTGCKRAIVPVLVFPKRPAEWEEMGWEIETGPPSIMRFKEITSFEGVCRWARTLQEMGYFHLYYISADPELQALLTEKYKEWWESYVLTEIEPPVRDYADIKALCPAPSGTIIADERVSRLMSEYDQIGKEIGAGGDLSKRREAIKVEVLEYMRGAGGVADDESQDKFILRDESGRKLASWGRNKAGKYVFR